MDRRRGSVSSLVLLLLAGACTAEKLSPNQKAPPFARGAGGLSLPTPLEGGAPKSPSVSENGVQWDETSDFKEVDGQVVRVVQGTLSYNSPEGLPIFVKYMADEQGNKASFRFGTGQGGTSGGPRGGPQYPGSTSGGGYPPHERPGGGSSTYLPPKNVDNTYLPPS
ncbi:uncharacterized protein LOC105699139 [Orussus abietinus]|uniref:uncharacterized protein LOC105699139 n=1 Tax=Orussus abietinus TaxID=222816 RepID=UPI000626776F|nr:uncharacterized protein LOC105699139 [Orussus abietinus]